MSAAVSSRKAKQRAKLDATKADLHQSIQHDGGPCDCPQSEATLPHVPQMLRIPRREFNETTRTWQLIVVGYIDRLGYAFCVKCGPGTRETIAEVHDDGAELATQEDTCDRCHEPIIEPWYEHLEANR